MTVGWLTGAAIRWGERLYTWGTVRYLLALPDSQLAAGKASRAAELIGIELKAIPREVLENILYHDAEVRLQTERLMRRYDLGGALNEAAQRAIADKQTVVPPGYPTPMQEAALKLQAQTLVDRIKRS